MTKGVATSFGLLRPLRAVCESVVYISEWKRWDSDLTQTPEADVLVPMGQEASVTASLMCLQVQAAPLWTTTLCSTSSSKSESLSSESDSTSSSHSSTSSSHSSSSSESLSSTSSSESESLSSSSGSSPASSFSSSRPSRSDGYAVSVPLDEVITVTMDKDSVLGACYRVRVRSTCNLFNEIMLRGVMSTAYAIRLVSVGIPQSDSHCDPCPRIPTSHVSRGIPRVFVIQGSIRHAAAAHPSSTRRELEICLSNDCMVTSVKRGSHDSPSPPPLRPIMNPQALAGLKGSIADTLASVMASSLRVRHVRLPRSVLTSIADYIMPDLFRNHAWLVPRKSQITVSTDDCTIVLNANGFPAFSMLPLRT